MNFFTRTDMYINVNISIYHQEVLVRYFLIRPFQKVKLPFNINIFISFILIHIWNSTKSTSLGGLRWGCQDCDGVKKIEIDWQFLDDF